MEQTMKSFLSVQYPLLPSIQYMEDLVDATVSFCTVYMWRI